MKQLFKDLKQFLWVIGIFIIGMFSLIFFFGDNGEDYSDDNYSTLSTKEAIEQHKRVRGGDKKSIDCSWCGGIGNVGYAGESEKQIKRTGMGLGNKCSSCRGTGKVEK